MKKGKFTPLSKFRIFDSTFQITDFTLHIPNFRFPTSAVLTFEIRNFKFEMLSITAIFCFLLSLSSQTNAQTGAALDFDGASDYVDIGSQSTLSNTTAFTIEAWLKRTSDSYPFPVFFSKSVHAAWGTNSINFGAWSSGAGIYARVAGSSDAYGYTTGTVLPTDTWVHIAVVYDGTASTNANRLKIYANGTLLSLTFVGTIPATTPTVSANTILGVATGSSHYWKGGIDEVRIWNRALCQGEIDHNKNCELGGSQTGLQSHYKFNQGTGEGSNPTETSLTDATGSSNGTLIGFSLSGATSNWISTGGVTTGMTCSAYLYPEINLKGNGNNITYGSTATASTNHTDFGSVLNGGSFARTFTIDNTAGTAPLTIGSITSSNTKFVVSNLPPSVSASNSGTFTVTFSPTAIAVETATITVNNNDCDEGTYTFAVTGTGSQVLSAELLGFKGQNTEGGNLLTWTTAEEKNVAHFDIERSTDGQSFTKIGAVKSKGSNSNYAFTDALTLVRFETLPTLRNTYYRLKINDLGGKIDYSKVIAIESNRKGKLAISPNPVSTVLTLNTEGGYFQIFNLLGQQVLTGKTAGQIDVAILPQGAYLLKIGVDKVKFAKQ